MSRLLQRTPGPYDPPVAVRELTAVSADGARLHVETYGPEGAPAVVLAHGWTCSTAFWAPVARELAAGFRVIAYDQRGHGRSPAASPAGYTTTVLADDLDAVLGAALEPGERAVLAGHSMGAMTFMAAAERTAFRAHAAAILLCSTGSSRLLADSRVLPLRNERIRTRAHRALLGSRLPLGPVTSPARRILKYMTMGADATPEMTAACARIVHACPPRVRAAWAHVLGELDLEANLGRLTVPTAVLAGTADRLTPIVHARRIVAALPDCVGFTELAGRGHMTPVEQPDAVVGMIRELVRDHLAAGGPPAVAQDEPTSAKVKEETS
ncbi:alpha/beta fold hydrolase [Streptomyces sp. NPDC048639]|uniref:alpha/beta fold hydrolase n=1 Tax=Streptomyces sp. NPDC048639 TaxID=3365581 RepID=UPI0037144D73